MKKDGMTAKEGYVLGSWYTAMLCHFCVITPVAT